MGVFIVTRVAAVILLLVSGTALAQSDNDPAAPQVLHLQVPAYPKEVKEFGLSGKVSVLVSIDESGKVTAVDDVAGPDWVCPSVTRPDVAALRQAAREAAFKATFRPAMKDGKPEKSTWRLNYQFSQPSDTGKNDGNYNPVPDIGGTDGLAVSDAPGGQATSLPKPAYSAVARAAGAAGSVDVQILIETDGTVFSAEAVSGHPFLRQAARIAACGARFRPTLLEGKPVKVSGIVTYNFVK
jgi:outer membrane biosynthesis protein TonB